MFINMNDPYDGQTVAEMHGHLDDALAGITRDEHGNVTDRNRLLEFMYRDGETKYVEVATIQGSTGTGHTEYGNVLLFLEEK